MKIFRLFAVIAVIILQDPLAWGQWTTNSGNNIIYPNSTYSTYNVGIGISGTSYPALAKLHVSGEGLFSVGITAGAPGLGSGSLSIAGNGSNVGLNIWKRTLTGLTDNTTAGNRWMWYNPDGSLRLYTGTTGDVVTVLTSGYVGIGSNTPAGKLQISGDAQELLYLDNPTTSRWNGIRFRDAGVDKAAINKEANGDLTFWEYGALAHEAMRILDTGGNINISTRLGLGTTTAQNKLDVAGGIVIGSTYAGTNVAPANGLLVAGNIGIGTTSPMNKVDISGGAVIGSTYAGVNTAPTNGLLVAGNVGIGTTNIGSAQLAVEGKIEGRSVVVTTTTPFPDYVFEDSYPMISLNNVEKCIKECKHLPDMPSAQEVKENGLNVGDMEIKLLKKVEELTIYVIDLKKQNTKLQAKIEALTGK